MDVLSKINMYIVALQILTMRRDRNAESIYLDFLEYDFTARP